MDRDKKLKPSNSKSKTIIKKSPKSKTLSKRTRTMNIPSPIKSHRKKIMETKSLGKIPSGFTSNIKPVSEKELKDFVNNDIDLGPQVVSIPIPPQRHAFLIDVQENKIMVSDWGGEENKTRGIKMLENGKKKQKNEDYDANWKQYSELMLLLEEKYDVPIEYYPVDKKLYDISYEHSEVCDGGGCSHYIYAWLKKTPAYSNYK